MIQDLERNENNLVEDQIFDETQELLKEGSAMIIQEFLADGQLSTDEFFKKVGKLVAEIHTYKYEPLVSEILKRKHQNELNKLYALFGEMMADHVATHAEDLAKYNLGID